MKTMGLITYRYVLSLKGLGQPSPSTKTKTLFMLNFNQNPGLLAHPCMMRVRTIFCCTAGLKLVY